jgi:hypothetical protein
MTMAVIIIIGKKDLSEPQPSSEESASFVFIRPPSFHFFGFCNSVPASQNKVISLMFSNQPGGADSCIYVTQ